MITELINGSDAFTVLANEWDNLARRGMTDTPFQTLAYQKAWWTHLHPENGRLHTITVRNQANELLAIACLYNLDGALYFNGCVEETDYLDLITSANDAEAAWQAILDCLCSPNFPEWHSIDLCNIPETSPTRLILAQEAQRRGFLFNERVNEVCPIIPLADTFEGYLDSIDSKQRREINRKLRRANGAEAELVVVGPDDDVDTAVTEFLDLLQKSTYEKRDWLTDGRRAVFYDAARAAQKAGTLQLLFIQVGGKKAAGLFNFDYKDRIWVYNSGLDPALFGALSLGVVITAKAIEYAIENGRTTFDFLRGNETYKYRFGAQDTTIYRLHLERKP
ncbi:MAG: GNAT family N-acetyltransferase [Ardenticatenaceae bacterium]|nr:GNAT family N-acetyltransferase [Anaerolineales bacterium]MCB9008309.1 GNAT family N-acetyltransferase [Ardenticatenaceae bacterium]